MLLFVVIIAVSGVSCLLGEFVFRKEKNCALT